MWCVCVSLGLVEDDVRVLQLLDSASLLAKVSLPFTAWLNIKIYNVPVKLMLV